MTHYNNYATDRLALILFDEVFKFLNQWTKLKLMVDTPVNIARKYFEIFPEDAVPLWRVSIQTTELFYSVSLFPIFAILVRSSNAIIKRMRFHCTLLVLEVDIMNRNLIYISL